MITPTERVEHIERAAKYLDSYARSAEIWIAAYEQHHDAASIRNLGFAMGRFDAAFQMVGMLDPSLITPERTALATRMSELWEAACVYNPANPKANIAHDGGITWY
jgi:hypothetical protein